MSIGKLWLYLRRKEEFWTFRLSGALRDTRGFMFNTMSVLDVFTSFLCPFSSHTEIAYSKWLLLFHRVKRETDLPVRLLEKFTYSNNEFFVYHIDTQVITQRKCIQNRRFSKHISYVAAWTSFNLQETSARTTVTQKKNKMAQYIHYLKPDESPEKCNMIVLQASTLT